MLDEGEVEELFDIWWTQEGSAIRPEADEDVEEHAKRVAFIAWSNGAYCESQSN